MTVTSITLVNDATGASSLVKPRPGVAFQGLAVAGAARGVAEDRVLGDGVVDTTSALAAAAVSLNLKLYATTRALLDEFGAFMHPSYRPRLVVTDSEWPLPRQLSLRPDGGSAPIELGVGLTRNVQYQWQVPAGVWEQAQQVELDVPVTLPSSTGLDMKPQGANFAFTATSATPAVFTATASNYPAGTAVIITGGSVPAGFTSGQVYWVVSPTANTFQLAASPFTPALASTSTGSGTVFATGGAHVSAAAGLDIAATTQPGEFSATNPGNAPAPWTASLYGPATGPKLANDTAGLTIEFTDSLTLAAGEFVLLDSRSRSASRNGDILNSVLSQLNLGTLQWWQLSPGVNQLRYYPTTGQSGTSFAQVLYQPRWIP